MQKKQAGAWFSGWWIVAATFVVLLVCGSGMYTFGVLVKPLEKSFGWTRTEISAAAAVWALMFGGASPLAAMSIERVGARATMIAGAILVGLGYLLLARMFSLWHLYAAMLIGGVGVACSTVVPVQTVVVHWFEKYRGRALGIAMLGFGIGGLVGPSLVDFVVEWYGWRIACLGGCFAVWLITIPTIAFFIRTRPSDIGLLPDGGSCTPDSQTLTRQRESGMTVRRALALPAFWQLFGIQVLLAFGTSALSVHFVPFATDIGFSSRLSANCWGLAIGASIVGRVGGGWLADRHSAGGLLTLAGLSLAAAVGVLQAGMQFGSDNAAPLYLFAILYGLGLGGAVVTLPVVVGKCFGMRHYGRILGLVFAGLAIGVVSGPVATAGLFDALGSYSTAFLLLLASFAGMSALALTLQPWQPEKAS